MKASEMPYNMNFEVDKSTLREFPEDPDQMAKGVEFLMSKLAEDGLSDVQSAALMTQIGVYCKITGDLDRSEDMLVNALGIFETEGHAEQAINIKFRLASTLHWKKKFTKAEKFFREGLKILKNSKSKKAKAYRDYGIFQYGKMKFEQAQYKEALDLFLEAHELRIISGDIDKVKHTEEAIAICRQRLESDE